MSMSKANLVYGVNVLLAKSTSDKRIPERKWLQLRSWGALLILAFSYSCSFDASVARSQDRLPLHERTADSITVPMLWDHWIENQRGLRSLPPVAIEAEVVRHGFGDQGIEYSRVTIYADRPEYLVEQGERIALAAGLQPPLKPWYVAIDEPNAYSFLEKDRKSERYRVGYVSPSRRDPAPLFLFDRILDLPVAISLQDRPLSELCSFEVESRSDDAIEVRFEPLTEEAKKAAGPRAGGMVQHLHVQFSKAEHWLPTRIDRYLKVEEANYQGYSTLMLDDYLALKDIFVPGRFGFGGGTESRDWSYGNDDRWNVEIESIKEVSRKDVTDRASKEFWDLPEQRSSSGVFFRVLLGIIAAVVLAIAVGISKYRARAT
ncbi:hypothetical protein [Stieleria mannarensis]|uniref:hypothetical protein n=1 Tax=Stieleria mannarensis TaxID=2755585 RepID=UPI001601FC98|nr:hypothetical protein [Rhodopirellula sp. JC639]